MKMTTRPQHRSRPPSLRDQTQQRSDSDVKPFNRVRREIWWLHTWLGSVIRDVQRKGGEMTGALKDMLDIAQRLDAQQRDSKN